MKARNLGVDGLGVSAPSECFIEEYNLVVELFLGELACQSQVAVRGQTCIRGMRASPASGEMA